eukprot:2942093-Rhodomonas_salina.4
MSGTESAYGPTSTCGGSRTLLASRTQVGPSMAPSELVAVIEGHTPRSIEEEVFVPMSLLRQKLSSQVLKRTGSPGTRVESRSTPWFFGTTAQQYWCMAKSSATCILIVRSRRSAGKVTLITRFGANNVEEKLPPLIQAVQDAGMSSSRAARIHMLYAVGWTSKWARI